MGFLAGRSARGRVYHLHGSDRATALRREKKRLLAFLFMTVESLSSALLRVCRNLFRRAVPAFLSLPDVHPGA